MKRILLFVVFLMVQLGFGQSPYTSVGSGNWNSDATWSGTGVPGVGDVVNIANGHTVIVTANAAASSVTFTGASATITVNTGFKLDVTNAVTLNSSNTVNTTALISGAGTLNCDSVAVGISGSPTVNATTLITSTIANFNITGNLGLISRRTTSPTITNNATFELQSGVLNVDGQITTSNQSAAVTSTFTMANGAQTGTLLLGNANPFNLSNTSTNIINLNGTGSTVRYDRSGNQTVYPTTYNGLIILGSGTKTASGSFTVSKDFSIQGGTFALNNNTSYSLTILGNYNQTGGVFDFNAGTSGTSNVYLAGNLTNSAGSGSISTIGAVKNGILTFNGSGIQTLNMPIAGAAIWAKYIVNTGSTLKLASNFTLNSADVTTQADWVGELTVNGTLDCGTFQVSQSDGTTGVAKVNLNSGATLITANPSGIDGSVLSTNLTRTLSSGANYNFNGTVAQTTSAGMPATVNSLTLSNPSGVTLSKATTVTNNFSIGSGTVANLGTFTHSAKFLVLGGTSYASQSWGSTSSPATNKRDDYFATTTTGIVNVNAYCLPTASTVRTIRFVSLNEIQNTSSGTTAYEDFTTSVSSANVSRGSSFTLGVRGNTGGANTHSFSVYFDWNQDGDFADSGEYVEIGTIRNSNGTENNKLASVFFTVPSTAILGLTRMRVINSSGGYSATDGCSINSSTGQAEDYLINITDLCSGTPVPGATASTNNPVCPNTPFTLSFSNPVVNGIQYTWESSLNGSDWSDSTANPINFFNTDFSTVPSNSNVYGGNASITGGELILTIINENNNPLGGFKIQKTLASAGLSSINAFTTKFKYRAFDGSGADGISLSYGASLGNNAGPGEEGEGSGLRLCLDTYDNDGTGTGSRVRIYYNNSFIFQNRIGSYDLRNAVYREVVLSVSNSGFLTLTIGGTTIVSGLSLPSYTAADKSNWNFKFSARTGGEDDKQSIDDIDIKYLDILPSNVLFTTQQMVATYYRVKATCAYGGGFDYSTPLLVNVDPVAPIIGSITQPTCDLATGSVALSGLPSSGTWTITATPATAGLSGLTGTDEDSTVVGGLTANTSYTFMVSNGTCSSIASAAAAVNAIPATATWNGSAWTGTSSSTTPPLITQPIVFAGNYSSSGNINGCSCTVTSGKVVINSGHTMTITNSVNVTNNATTSLVFEDNASLVQTTNTTNTGAIEYRRISKPMKNFDYTYWSSPVWGDGTIVPKQTAKNLSPNTLADKYFRFDGDVAVNDWVFDDGEMTPGVGFIIRVPKPGSPAPDNWSGTTYPQPVAFKGIPNNGNYFFTVDAGEFNLIGNPYPSAIDADLFITNPNNATMINGALYFWTHNTAITNNEYTADDYASYTLTGSTGTGVGNFVDANDNGIMDPGEEVVSNRPLGKIAAGQSFFVENAAPGSFQFTNAMRVAGNNSQFFKQVNTKKTATVEKNRVWLNLTNSGGAFKQLLVGYITGATNDWDNMYDGPTFDGQEFVDFYSINQGKNLTIQGRALPFANTDIVPLGYRSTIAGAFDISIDNRDGALAGQEIWLEDKKTNTLHELTKGKYTFTAINGVENDRFVLKYTNKTLGTDDNKVVDKSLIVSVKNKKITLTSSAEAISQVQLFDLLGRKVYDKSKINAQEWSISNLSSSEQTLIVKTTLANGAISNKKIIY